MPKYEIEATAPTLYQPTAHQPITAGQYYACITVEAESEKEALEKADVLFREIDESNEFVETDFDNVLEQTLSIQELSLVADFEEDEEPDWFVDYKKINYKIVEVTHVS